MGLECDLRRFLIYYDQIVGIGQGGGRRLAGRGDCDDEALQVCECECVVYVVCVQPIIGVV